jgi:hypothetical protein
MDADGIRYRLVTVEGCTHENTRHWTPELIWGFIKDLDDSELDKIAAVVQKRKGIPLGSETEDHGGD